MLVQNLGQQPLAEVHLRLGVVGGVALVLDHLEPQVVERATHIVEPVLRLDDNLIEALPDGPELLLLGQGAEMTLASPVAARAADPGVEDMPAVELDVVAEAAHEIRELRLRLADAAFVRD